MELNLFHELADGFLEAIEDQIVAADKKGALDTELHQGVLTITLPSGREMVVNKHTPTRQIWLSSPLSGGMHFQYDDSKKNWYSLGEGLPLLAVLSEDLTKASGVTIAFPY